jgi:prepilin-type N-terminal cleavage/methylation domain-containing protein
MLLLAKEYKNRGFTMIEMMMVLTIFGILAAIGIPSFISMNNRAKLKNNFVDFSSHLLEVQRAAIRKSKSCMINLPASGMSSPTIDSPCSISGNLTLSYINMRNNITSISFNYRGDTSTSTSTKGTIVFSLPDGTGEQKCLVISQGIGLIGIGNYDANDRTGTDPNKCYSSQ